MAKLILVNTREHAIHLNTPKDTVLVPGSKQNPDDRSKLIHGTLAVESDFLDQAKKHPVVQHYFKEGWLRIQSGEQKQVQQPQKPEPPQK